MSRPTKHPKTGVYWLRKRVPADLLKKIGREEINRSLGTRDPAEAKRKHAELLAELEAQWSAMRHGAPRISDREAHLYAAEVGARWFEAWKDNPSEQVEWQEHLYKRMWTSEFAFVLQEMLKSQPVGPKPTLGNIPDEAVCCRLMQKRCFDEASSILRKHGFEEDAWSLTKTAEAVSVALQHASGNLRRLYPMGGREIDDTYAARLSSVADVAAHRSSESSGRTPQLALGTQATSLKGLVEDWWKESRAAGRKPSTYESYRNTISNFVRFLGHDDGGKVSAQDVVGFKDHRLTTPSPRTGKVPSAKTVKDSDLSALRALFDWAIRNGHMTENPAAKVSIKLGKPRRLRSKGLSDDEAAAILTASSSHQQGGENPKTFAAKRWVPWLCAFTGARVGELAQLRKQDVFKSGEVWAIRITPEAGTVKTNDAREVPLHQQLIDLGFPEFIERCKEGHVFLNVAPDKPIRGALRGLKNRLAEFARGIVPDPNVAPNHGWRHRFKTVGMEAGIPPRILDAIQGQAPRSVADTYGDVTLKTMATEIAKLPRYSISGPTHS